MIPIERKVGDMFQVKCIKEWGEWSLSTTNNGYQWTSLRLKDQTQMQGVVDCLQSTIERLEQDYQRTTNNQEWE